MFGFSGYRPSNLWDEMEKLHREMSQIVTAGRGGSGPACSVYPPLNLYEDVEAFVVRAEIPGVDPKSLEVTAAAGTLTIKGSSPRLDPKAEVSVHRRERDHGKFHRALSLPQSVDPDKIVASYKYGVLEVMLPKAESVKPRKIVVAE
ncbi:MAG: Hsp20/alpha crystallin family protein [Myxococcota bacterium]|nr:Hsp20/alpha crystallin family protein [Myxococcota bacterium]